MSFFDFIWNILIKKNITLFKHYKYYPQIVTFKYIWFVI